MLQQPELLCSSASHNKRKGCLGLCLLNWHGTEIHNAWPLLLWCLRGENPLSHIQHLASRGLKSGKRQCAKLHMLLRINNSPVSYPKSTRQDIKASSQVYLNYSFPWKKKQTTLDTRILLRDISKNFNDCTLAFWKTEKGLEMQQEFNSWFEYFFW